MLTLTREQLRRRIDLLEALESVMRAIEDVDDDSSHDEELIDIQVTDRSNEKAAIAVAHALPRSAVLTGLQAMRHQLDEATRSAP